MKKRPLFSRKPTEPSSVDPSALLGENKRLQEENRKLRRALEQSEQQLVLARETARSIAGDKKKSGDTVYATALREAASRLSGEIRDGDGSLRYALDSRIEAVEFTGRLQSDILAHLAEASRAIASTRQSITDILGDWQRAIYLRDLKPLAFSLQQFERLIASVADEETKNKMSGLLHSFEEALKRIGIIPFSPDVGEPFDQTRYTAVDENTGKYVREVVVRGYQKINDTSGNMDILAPSEVILTTSPPSAGKQRSGL